MSHAIPLKRITLHLARSKQHPDGSARHGYEFVAPLRPDGTLDAEVWKEARAACRVKRFWEGEPDETGHLIHRPGGKGGATWAFDYDPAGSADDEAGYRFGDHPMTVGEYLSVRDEGGELHTFRISAVRPA